MTESEARAVVFALIAAFPQATIEQESADLFTAQLTHLGSPSAAGKALERIVQHSRQFPTIAEFRDMYANFQALESPGYQLDPPLPEGERLALARDAARIAQGFPDGDDAPSLSEAPSGKCDDCGKDGQRVKYEKLELCPSCGGSRFRVRSEIRAA